MGATRKEIAGRHYADRAIQPIEQIASDGLDFVQGNVLKYITRYKFKNGDEDLRKAEHYCELGYELKFSNGATPARLNFLEMYMRANGIDDSDEREALRYVYLNDYLRAAAYIHRRIASYLRESTPR